MQAKNLDGITVTMTVCLTSFWFCYLSIQSMTSIVVFVNQWEGLILPAPSTTTEESSREANTLTWLSTGMLRIPGRYTPTENITYEVQRWIYTLNTKLTSVDSSRIIWRMWGDKERKIPVQVTEWPSKNVRLPCMERRNGLCLSLFHNIFCYNN